MTPESPLNGIVTSASDLKRLFCLSDLDLLFIVLSFFVLGIVKAFLFNLLFLFAFKVIELLGFGIFISKYRAPAELYPHSALTLIQEKNCNPTYKLSSLKL